MSKFIILAAFAVGASLGLTAGIDTLKPAMQKPTGMSTDGSMTYKMTKSPHGHLDVLFLDIDGGEYQLLNGFIANECRPKIICVEYDNTFPLSIDYVPTKYRHQASSIAFYK